MTINHERANLAREFLLTQYGNEYDTEVIDLLTNLRHLCREEEIDFDRCFRLAEIHFKAEVDEGRQASKSNPELLDALFDVKHLITRYHDHDTDNDTLVDLIEDRVMTAIQQAEAQGE